jgi:hypothetical protein
VPARLLTSGIYSGAILLMLGKELGSRVINKLVGVNTSRV